MITGQVFCRIFPNGYSADALLIEKLGFHILEGRPQMNSVISSHISRAHTYYQHDSSLLMMILITWLRQCFIRFLYCQVIFFFHFSYCTIWKKVIMYSPLFWKDMVSWIYHYNITQNNFTTLECHWPLLHL